MTSEDRSDVHTGGGNARGRRQSFGSVRELPSGRWQARYVGPDGVSHRAPTTFQTKGDAQTWLSPDAQTSPGKRGSQRPPRVR